MAIFTGRHVEVTGLTVAVLSSVFLLHGVHRIGALTGIAVYLLDRFYPKAFNWLSNFAEPATWPGYVALGVAALFSAHAGGWQAVVVLTGLLTAGDGRMFEALY